jgi:predicted Fe-Mo cluster-binding NifX family protein
MKIAVTATGPTLDSLVEPRFDWAEFLLIMDTGSGAAEALRNPLGAAAGGAGVETARLIAEQGAQVVLTGECSAEAHQALSTAGISVHLGASGFVREALDRFKRGGFKPTDSA